MGGKQDLSTLLWWVMWLRNQKKGRESKLVGLFLLYILIQVIDLGLSIPQKCYRLDLSWHYTPTPYSTQSVANHKLVIEPLYYTYNSGRVLVAPPWWWKSELHNDMPPHDQKVITYFPIENSDPVNIEQRYTGTLAPNISTLLGTDTWWLTITLWALQSQRWMMIASWHAYSLQWYWCHQSLNLNNDGNSYHYGNYTNTSYNLWHNSKYKCRWQDMYWWHSGLKNYVKTEGLQLNVDQPWYDWHMPDQHKEFRIFHKNPDLLVQSSMCKNYMARTHNVMLSRQERMCTNSGYWSWTSGTSIWPQSHLQEAWGDTMWACGQDLSHGILCTHWVG